MPVPETSLMPLAPLKNQDTKDDAIFLRYGGYTVVAVCNEHASKGGWEGGRPRRQAGKQPGIDEATKGIFISAMRSFTCSACPDTCIQGGRLDCGSIQRGPRSTTFTLRQIRPVVEGYKAKQL